MPASEAEPARGVFVELFPAGFEEIEQRGAVELAAYADGVAEARLRERFASVTASAVAPGWETRWREFHRPVRVGKLWIGPPWESPPGDAIAVVIEPGRAFGTGGHATTRLCLELLVGLQSELGGGSVLDLGCGSGVLSIAAARLGYGPVFGLDLGPAAVEETQRNAERNGVDVDVRAGDALSAELLVADLVLANIARPTIDALAARLRCRVLVASGYLDGESAALPGFRHRERATAEGWAADVYEHGELSVRSRDRGVT